MDKEYIGVRIRELGDSVLNMMNILISKSSSPLMIYFNYGKVFKLFFKLYVKILSIYSDKYLEILKNINFLERNIRSYTLYVIMDIIALDGAFEKETYNSLYVSFCLDMMQLMDKRETDLFDMCIIESYIFRNITVCLLNKEKFHIKETLREYYQNINNPKKVSTNMLVNFWFSFSTRKKKFMNKITEYCDNCNIDDTSLYHKYEGCRYTTY